MKTVRHINARDNLLHVETEGCIVNIRTGLHDRDGRAVTSIEILADNYVGEEWTLDGYVNNRVIQGADVHVPRVVAPATVKEFKKNQRVMTPDGPGTVDGYGSPDSTTQKNYDWVWVWLDEKVNGTTFRPYQVQDVQNFHNEPEGI